ncbi:MAG: diacylglycerol kinase family protein [Myxococcota bacterium]
MRDTLVIVNEHAGGGQMADTFRRLEHPLQDAIGIFDIAFTDGPGHAIELTRNALAAGGRKRIIAGGGDGTLNEVVNGFFDPQTLAPLAPDVAFAVLAGGTGGDFRKTIRVSGPDATLAALRGGKTMAIDVGLVTARDERGGPDLKRFFLNIASFGLSGRADRIIPEFKALGGKLGYFAAMAKALWGWRNPRVRLTIDGEPLPPQPINTVAVGNGRYFGGGMMVCPDARLDSGVLDVTVLGDFTRLESVLQTRAIYSGDHVYHPKVKTRRGKDIVATVDDGESDTVALDIDGEAIGLLPARFEVRPAALKLIVP